MKPLRTSAGAPWAAAALLAAAVLAVYGFTLGFGFVYDDHLQVERNPWLRAPDGLRLFLTRPFWGFEPGSLPSNYYRPAFGAFDSLLARLYGPDPTAFHAASVALHLAVCLLVALALCCALTAQVAPGGGGTRDSFVLSGSVINAASGEPIAHALVRATGVV